MHEDAPAIGRPSQWDHRTQHVIEIDVDAIPRVEVPDRRPLDPGALLGEEESPSPRRRRPGDRLHPEIRVDLVARALTGPAVQDTERLPVDVPVLGVMDADQGTVRRQPASALGPFASDTRGLPMPVDLARSFVPYRDERAIVLVGREAGGDAPLDQRETHHPLVVEPTEERTRVAALERRDHPAPALVPDLVVPPHHARPVRQDVGLLGPDAPFRDATPLARSDVPGPGLRAPVLGRHRRQVIGRPRRPAHLLDRRMGESLGPGRARAHGAEDMPPGRSGGRGHDRSRLPLARRRP